MHIIHHDIIAITYICIIILQINNVEIINIVAIINANTISDAFLETPKWKYMNYKIQ